MTKTKDVKGMVVTHDSFLPRAATVTVRYTSDRIGKTLSFSWGDQVMIGVPLEAIEDMLEEEDNC